MPKKKNKLINLLPQEEFEASVTGRILRWAMTTFRYIVIVTELIVMGAFLSRFWLDAKNSDLNDSIKTKAAQIATQKEFEKTFRDLQGRLKIVSDLGKENPPTSTLDKIISKTPPNVVFQNISYQESAIQIKAVSGSEIGVAQFLSNLKAEKDFKDVVLGQIETSEEDSALIIFTVKIDY